MPPMYLRLKESLANEILEGKYLAGDLLPSESDLIKAWSVSRVTVRNAIKELSKDGLVYSVRGKGTFVAEPTIVNFLPSMTSYSHDVIARGMEPGTEVIYFEDEVPVTNNVASKLQVPPGSHVIHFDRLLLADAKPVSIGYTYLSLSSIVPHQNRLREGITHNRSLYQLLSEIGVCLKGGHQTVSATAATREQAELLKVPVDSPLIYSERVAYDLEKRPIEYTVIVSRPDRTQWRILLGPPDG